MSNPQPLPLFDLFLDLPHPAGAASCPPPNSYACPATNPEVEKEIAANMSRIAMFAFPEFDDTLNQRIPRDKALNRFSQYAMQPKGFQNYTFSLQLKSGVRVHGFVRRYLPMHQLVEHRYDVGRRGERALVMLTRFSGGDLMFASVLKTIDTILCQKAALDPKYIHSEPQKLFLNRIYEEHQKLCHAFLSTPQQERPLMVMSIGSVEVGNKPIRFLNQVDTSNFLVPTSLLAKVSNVEAMTSSPILPLLRVLGVSSTLRLLSALLSENRVLLISANPTRLAQCARSALSILAQGLLNWQHLYIPVLPPHLFQYLGAPVPYLIGILSAFVPKLNADGLGEMVIINLDTNQMETRGMNPMDVARKVPDLFQKAVSEQGMPASTMSASEMLAQDLIDLLKVDKRAIYGESTLTNVSETAAKATKAVKSGFNKLASKGKKFFNTRKGSLQSIDSIGSVEEEVVETNTPEVDLNTMLPDAVYVQGSRNEFGEEQAKIAFASFYLSIFGNMRWYLSAMPGKLPHLDRKRFLQQKRAMGGESTPIWPLLQNFCESQMLEEFAKARVDEVRLRKPVTTDSPLFTQCANYHRLNNIDFSVVNVRRVSRQVAESNPSRMIMQASFRRTAMLITSNKTYDGDYNKAVAHLVEQCRESAAVLSDVMSVIWVRIRDSKGVHWKHGLQALQVLRNLLYHGPLAAIAEATDGLDKIRAMKFYNDHMRSQICTQIRQAAHQVYNLLVDRAKLFHIRRICVKKRLLLKQPEQSRYIKNTRISITHRFGAMHQHFNPNAARVAPAPRSGPQPSTGDDIFGLTSPSAGGIPAAPKSADVAQDIVGLFSNIDVSNQSTGGASPAPASRARNPFDPAPTPNSQMSSPPPQSVPRHPGAITPQPSTPHSQNLFSPVSAATAQPLCQGSPAQKVQQQATRAPIPGQPITYGSPYPQTSTPTHHQRPAAPQQQYYQPQPPGQHPPSGPPQKSGYAMSSPQQQHQYNQAGGYKYAPGQQQHQHYQHPPSQQQQYATQQAPPAQPPKPNLSQFDPFQ